MIKTIFFDAGGVLILNNNGEAVINQDIINFINIHKEDYFFGVLSSTDLPLQNILKSYGIDSLFKTIQTSKDLNEDKDHKNFFSKAISTVGIEPHEAIMVDNDLDFVAAAQEAGLQKILYSVDIDLEGAVTELLEATQ